MNPEEIIHAFENGDRELEPLLEKMGWKSWLGIAELGLVMQSDIVTFLEEKLSPAESKVLDLVKKRIAGEIRLRFYRRGSCSCKNTRHQRLST